MAVSRSYTGLVRIDSKTSKHRGRIARMTGWGYGGGCSNGIGYLLIDGNRVNISLENLTAVSDSELKKDAIKKTHKVFTKMSDDVTLISAEMTEKEAIEHASKTKIENPESQIEIWKMVGIVSTPRTFADIIPV